MTRLDNLYGMVKQDWTKQEILNEIDSINTDFKSRTCENCKHSEYHNQQDILECYKLFEELNQRCYKCENDITIFEVVNDFSCNKFERKEDD